MEHKKIYCRDCVHMTLAGKCTKKVISHKIPSPDPAYAPDKTVYIEIDYRVQNKNNDCDYFEYVPQSLFRVNKDRDFDLQRRKE